MTDYVNANSEMVMLRAAIHGRMADIARFLFDAPNARMSTRREFRFGNRGSVSVVVAGPKVGTWYDHEAGKGGDAFDLISQRLGLNFPQTKEWAIHFIGCASSFTTEDKPIATLSAANDNIEFAQRIWGDSTDPRGTVVEAYLASRQLPIEPGIAGAVIRFQGALLREGVRVPGMVALLRDLRSNEPCGIHRTFLTPDGTKLDKKMLGRTKHAAIKLSSDECVSYGLHVGEGIETCMSWMQLGYRPTWALGSSGAIAKLPVLPGIDALTILKESRRISAKRELSAPVPIDVAMRSRSDTHIARRSLSSRFSGRSKDFSRRRTIKRPSPRRAAERATRVH